MMTDRDISDDERYEDDREAAERRNNELDQEPKGERNERN